MTCIRREDTNIKWWYGQLCITLSSKRRFNACFIKNWLRWTFWKYHAVCPLFAANHRLNIICITVMASSIYCMSYNAVLLLVAASAWAIKIFLYWQCQPITALGHFRNLFLVHMIYIGYYPSSLNYKLCDVMDGFRRCVFVCGACVSVYALQMPCKMSIIVKYRFSHSPQQFSWGHLPVFEISARCRWPGRSW